MAIWIVIIMVPLLSVIDLGLYVYRKMQVQIAAQQSVEAVRRACGWAAEPVTNTSQCAGGTLSAALAAGRTNTSLTTYVTMDSGYPVEGYYCVNSSGALTGVGTAGTIGSPPTKPANCSSVTAGSTALPADYIQVRLSYAYTPLFGGLSITTVLPNPIKGEAWLRLG